MEKNTARVRVYSSFGILVLLVGTAVYAQDEGASSSTPESTVETSADSTPTTTSANADSDSTSSGRGFFRGLMPEFDFTFSGFIRPETALSTRNADDPDNERGNVYDGVAITRHPGDPLTGYGSALPALNALPAPVLNTILAASPACGVGAGNEVHFGSEPDGALACDWRSR